MAGHSRYAWLPFDDPRRELLALLMMLRLEPPNMHNFIDILRVVLQLFLVRMPTHLMVERGRRDLLLVVHRLLLHLHLRLLSKMGSPAGVFDLQPLLVGELAVLFIHFWRTAARAHRVDQVPFVGVA